MGHPPALDDGSPEKALEALAPASPYELGVISGSADFALYPVSVRGEAYLKAHDGVKAAAEFQKLIDHHGVVLNEPIAALAHLGPARAYALQVETNPAARDKARTGYQDFLMLWKDADTDIPVYRNAKAEHAKLQ